MPDMSAAKDSLSAMMQENAKIRAIAHSYLVPKEGSDDSKDARKMAQGHAASEVMVTIFGIFNGLRTPSENAMYTLLNDMTVALNVNPFWAQYASTLMPLFIAAVNAANDARELKAGNEVKWSNLQQQSANLWVELMPAIVFLVHGYGAMRLASVEIKKSFLGLMYG